jgi:hypothetical protein
MESWQIEMIRKHNLKKGDFLVFEIVDGEAVLLRCADSQGNSYRFFDGDNKLLIGSYKNPLEHIFFVFTKEIQKLLGLQLKLRERREGLVFFDVV